ncbi:MAG: DNA-binding transcriptional LysR family regulator [Granulosicoccus sp.]|jgi:DNA-binding transcriptional LysR family regulator
MYFKHYDSLRLFTHVAGHGSFSAAAEPLNLTKGAIGHQIRLLESSLGFAVFHRKPRGVVLTSKGEKHFSTCVVSFTNIETVITDLKRSDSSKLTLGVTTYFASRWLSQRLMNFMQLNPDIRLSLQPMIDLSDLDGEGIDLAIRWSNGEWRDLKSQLLFSCPA